MRIQAELMILWLFKKSSCTNFPYETHVDMSAPSAQSSNPRPITMSSLKPQYPWVIAVALDISPSLGGDFAHSHLVYIEREELFQIFIAVKI